MCGINGFTGSDRELIDRMNEATSHRGPDGVGVYEDNAVTLGHNRLAIIDLSAKGAQPMKSADGRYVITFNGEIYNYKELKSEFSSYPYASESDTEVILAGFSSIGPRIFEKLNGIFAFAIWDSRSRALYLARDRQGIKPLYYFSQGRRILFSSEIKAILEDQNVPRTLNTSQLHLYLRLGYVPGPETLFERIKKIPSGHFARIAELGMEIERFAPAVDYTPELSGKAAEDLVRETLDGAVRRQLVSDRPLGVFLSGGIDSSSVLDAMSKVHTSIDTYSVGFNVPNSIESEKFNADFFLARRTAAHYGARHHEYMLDAENLPTLIESVTYHLDEPIGNATALAQFSLSKMAKESVTVVLCGDGGDELFGGYPRYLLSRRMDAYQALVPSPLRSLLSSVTTLRKLNVPQGEERYDLFHFIKTPVLKEIAPHFAGDVAQQSVREELDNIPAMPFAEKFMALDRAWWLTDESLVRTDKMTMASGIEARVPILDNEMLALAQKISVNEKVSPFETKIVLKRAMRSRLPSYLFDQPKRGWFSPGAKWLRIPHFTEYARNVLSKEYAEATSDIFDWEGISRILEDHVEGRRYNLHLIWTLLSLQIWARAFRVSV